MDEHAAEKRPEGYRCNAVSFGAAEYEVGARVNGTRSMPRRSEHLDCWDGER